MPTGSGKTPLYTFLNDLIQRVRSGLKLTENDPVWCLDEASFEMMGFLMARNNYALLGLYDEFSTFSLKSMSTVAREYVSPMT